MLVSFLKGLGEHSFWTMYRELKESSYSASQTDLYIISVVMEQLSKTSDGTISSQLFSGKKRIESIISVPRDDGVGFHLRHFDLVKGLNDVGKTNLCEIRFKLTNSEMRVISFAYAVTEYQSLHDSIVGTYTFKKEKMVYGRKVIQINDSVQSVTTKYIRLAKQLPKDEILTALKGMQSQ